MYYYGYQELIHKVKEDRSNPEALLALGKWFEENGRMFWNGQSYDTEKEFDGYNLFPIYDYDESYDIMIVGYELRCA